MIKVMHICPQLGKGGIEKLIQQWEARATENSVQFVFGVYVPGGYMYDYFTAKGYEIITIQQAKTIGIKQYIKQIEKIVAENEIDILHINAGPITWLTLLGAKKGGVKHRFLHAHTNLYIMNLGKLLNYVMHYASIFLNTRYATKLIACGKDAGEYCFGKHNFIVLKNGIDIKQFSYSEQNRNEIRQKMGLEQKFVLGFVGRLEHQKNPMFALQVFKELKGKLPEAKMLFVGDGSYQNEMKEYCRESNIEDAVVFAGGVPNPAPYYSAMDAFILPSLYEGLGIVAVEAQTSGQPVFLSTCIPKEVGICSNVHFCALEEGADKWADNILMGKESPRIDRTEEIVAAGYEKESSVKELMKIYVDTYGENVAK